MSWLGLPGDDADEFLIEELDESVENNDFVLFEDLTGMMGRWC